MRDPGRVIVHSPRISERRRAVRAERRRRRMRIGVVGLVIGGLAAGGFGLTRTPVFALDRIEVVGVPRTAQPAILAASGLRVGQPALGIDLERAAAAIRALDSVEDARIVRTSTLALRVDVQPRTAAVIADIGTGLVLLDEHGEQVPSRPRGRLPRIEAPDVAAAAAMAPEVLSIWKSTRARERKTFDSFRPSKAGIVAMMGDTGVLFGAAEQVRAKLHALRLVLRRIKAEDRAVSWIDLRAPGRPAVRVA